MYKKRNVYLGMGFFSIKMRFVFGTRKITVIFFCRGGGGGGGGILNKTKISFYID